MRILHTADWHMQDRLGRQSRSKDIECALEQIAAYLEQYSVDVMIVAGDIFSEQCRTEQTREAVTTIKRVFSPFIERGGSIVAISGNHDSELLFDTLRDVLELGTPQRTSTQRTQSAGQLYITAKPCTLKLIGKDGVTVQFILMPYPTPRYYLNNTKSNYKNVEEKYQHIRESYQFVLNGLLQKLDVQLPAILVSHIHVHDAHIHSNHGLGDEETIMVPSSDIPAHLAYVAYGHIHLPQKVFSGAEHIRYSGSIERMDIGEREEKSVVLFDIGTAGLIDKPSLQPLKSRSVYHVEITDPDTQISTLMQEYPDAENALVKYTLHWDAQKHNREELCRVIETVFPYWYERNCPEVGQSQRQKTVFSQQNLQDVVGTVRDYLTTNLAENSQQEALLTLANEILAQEVWK